MPFALEGIAVMADLALFLLAIAVYYLITGIGKLFSPFHVLWVVVDLASVWDSLTNPVTQWLQNYAVQRLHAIEAWVRGIAYLATTLFDDVTGAVGHALTGLEHVVTVEIPNAAEGALNTAKHAVGESAATIAHDISVATADIEKVASADAAQALAKAKAAAKGIESDLTRIVAHDLTVAKNYTDTKIADAEAIAKGLVDALPSVDIGPLTTTVGTIAATAAGAAAAAAAITSEFESCAVTSCEGPNNLSNLLSTLLGGVDLVLVAQFLESVISDPATAVTTYAGDFQSDVTRGVSTFQQGGDWLESLLGI